MLGAIELGGTKIMCGVGNGPMDIALSKRLRTTTPEENLTQIIEFFEHAETKLEPITSIGVASFGPINIDPTAENYGTFFKTPKIGWTDFALRSRLQKVFNLPIAVTTDVNGALLAEHSYGAAKSVDDCVYLTIGTGVGAGLMSNGQLINGFLHPEVGHMRIPSQGVKGVCPFHGNCVEGLVSGPAIAARAGVDAAQLSDDDPVWAEVAINIADLCVNILFTVAAKKIILGGGVMGRKGLIKRVRAEMHQRLASYLPLEELAGGLGQIIVSPGLADNSGLVGAFILATKQ